MARKFVEPDGNIDPGVSSMPVQITCSAATHQAALIFSGIIVACTGQLNSKESYPCP